MAAPTVSCRQHKLSSLRSPFAQRSGTLPGRMNSEASTEKLKRFLDLVSEDTAGVHKADLDLFLEMLRGQEKCEITYIGKDKIRLAFTNHTEVYGIPARKETFVFPPVPLKTMDLILGYILHIQEITHPELQAGTAGLKLPQSHITAIHHITEKSLQFGTINRLVRALCETNHDVMIMAAQNVKEIAISDSRKEWIDDTLIPAIKKSKGVGQKLGNDVVLAVVKLNHDILKVILSGLQELDIPEIRLDERMISVTELRLVIANLPI